MYSTSLNLFIIQLAICVVFATPNLGIRPDFLQPFDEDLDRGINSYSGIITFADGTIPLDKSKMTDAKLIHLASVACNEMIESWKSRKLPDRHLPAAMAAFAYHDKIFFASSIRAPPGTKLAEIPKGSVREYMDNALWNDGSKLLPRIFVFQPVHWCKFMQKGAGLTVVTIRNTLEKRRMRRDKPPRARLGFSMGEEIRTTGPQPLGLPFGYEGRRMVMDSTPSLAQTISRVRDMGATTLYKRMVWKQSTMVSNQILQERMTGRSVRQRTLDLRAKKSSLHQVHTC
ncbi:MAG: hypothetical protein Q9223_002254 [Gallowayella weberi]